MNIYMSILLFSNIITSFLITYLAIPPIIRVSNAKHLFDVPNHRKLNKTVVPTLGGISIFIGLTLSSFIFLENTPMPEGRFLFAAIVMMFFTGLKDDLLIISAKKKLMVQIAASLLLVILGKFRITHTYELASISHLNDWFSIPLSVLIILFVINSINLIDGIDGLAAGVSLLISSVLGGWFYMAGFVNYGIICLALAGSLLAFLRFNLWGGKNKIFMGDTGSLILGILLAAVVIKFNELNFSAPYPFHFNQAPVMALALFIVPVTDTIRIFTIRIYQKKSPFSPDMNHIHHLLIKSGLSHIQASSFLVAYTGLFILMALTMEPYLNITLGFPLLLALSFAMAGIIYKKSKQAEERATVIASDEPGIIIRLPFQNKAHGNPPIPEKRRIR